MDFLQKILVVLLMSCEIIFSTGEYQGSIAELVDSILDRPTYDKRIRPYAGQGQPAKISLDVYILSISSVSEVSMDMTATLYLRMYWKDPRLAYTEVKDPIILNYNQFDRLWVPDVFFTNEKRGLFHTLTVPNRLLKLWPDGTLLYSQRLSVTLSCYMYLKDYPMDNQTCPISFESYGYTTDEIEFEWKKGGGLEVNDKLVLPEFSVTGTSIANCTVTYATGSFTCMQGYVYLKREINYFMIQVYVPSILIVMLSWVNFWIDPKAVPARVTIGLITVLTITTQSTGISSRLPKVAYVKAIDVWMATCLVFVFGALIEYAIVNVLLRTHDQKKAITSLIQKGNSPLKIGSKKGKLSITDLDSKPATNGTEATKADEVIDIEKYQPKDDKDSDKKVSCLVRYFFINGRLNIDVVARIFFPSTFTLFNIIYWVFNVTTTYGTEN